MRLERSGPDSPTLRTLTPSTVLIEDIPHPFWLTLAVRLGWWDDHKHATRPILLTTDKISLTIFHALFLDSDSPVTI